MKQINGALTLSPTDLSNHLACPHGTTLDLAVAKGEMQPPTYTALITAALRQRGVAHENAYIEFLKSDGLTVVDLRQEPVNAAAINATMRAMESGTDVIVQAPLVADRWGGRADILQRVDSPSELGKWSYEPTDTKLAIETKGGTILQLCAYAEMLTALQGTPPTRFHVVTPGAPFNRETYRFDDFGAYYRLVKRRLIDLTTGVIAAETYPEPVDHCDICRWWEICDRRRRDDDHLSFVAGIGRTQRDELVAQGFPTLAAAAAMPLPIPFKPTRGSRETYTRIREQARVQNEQRTLNRPVHELLDPIVEGQGLARLPEPSVGDLFLDLEGARYARQGGREYLFGIWGKSSTDGLNCPGYQAVWAFTDAEERAAFERTIDRVMETLAAHPGAHIYHFGHYESSTFKRLMGRYATRAEELDQLLRSGRFVDLHLVVRQGLRAGVESYSIKQLEQFYAFQRAMPLRDASEHLHAIELALESNAPTVITDESRDTVQAYNEDDCRSTAHLRDWLESLRAQLESQGTMVPRPAPKDGEASEQVGELEARQQAARERLLAGLGPSACDPADANHPLWLLAYLIDWHRREAKSAWWEYFRLRDLPDADLLDERSAIAGLQFIERVQVVVNSRTKKPTGSVIDRYSYPEQEVDLHHGAKLSMSGGDNIGELIQLDRAAGTVDIKKGSARAEAHPTAVFEGDVVGTRVQQEALLRFSEDPHHQNCGTDLLFRRRPRLRSGEFRPPAEGESIVEFATGTANKLDRTTLGIQGPPGAGKTYVGAQMIRALARAGKKVGVTAVSHKVIRNLLIAVQEQEAGKGKRNALRLGHKCEASDEGPSGTEAAIEEYSDNDGALNAIKGGDVQVLGGTSWLWSREDAASAVDVLFVDEAGQMSLANVLAISGATSSLVLLGDPQQLEQPQKGTHPDGVDVSALDHVLGGAATMPPDKGLFLPTTWRLHPSICAFTSELFYDGKLEAKPGLERQRLLGTDSLDGAGLWWCPVDHHGNRNASIEEVEAVSALVRQLLKGGAQWEDDEGVIHPLISADLRIVAPYNAQVNRVAERLGDRGVPVGTVDKFQGQEAPLVIYSMATSSPEDAPRGMEFLYSLNRLNVATSRARCAAIIVGSPKLLSPSCVTPRQMRLANAMCRYVERASLLEVACG